MSQPFDRNCSLPALGAIDEEAGEFWVENPFQMPTKKHNLSAYERNCVFLNVGGLAFIDASFATEADIDADSRAAIACDFDNDGVPELLVGSVGGGVLRLFENRFPQGNRVRVDLAGVESNRAAIGTHVVAYIGDRQVVRDVFPFDGCMGQAPPELLIGLGDAVQIDRLVVRWPTGATEEFGNVPAGRVSIIEGEGRFDIVPQTPAKR